MQQERLIGRVVVAWAKLESALDGLIWHLLSLEIEDGRIITARLDAVAKIKMSRDLGNLNLSEEQFRQLSPILDRIDILREDRNHIVHGMWARNREGIPITFSLRTKPLEPDQVVAEAFPDTRMRDIVHDIDAGKYKIMLLLKELGASLDKPSLPPPED
jgi:hypothetical protein